MRRTVFNVFLGLLLSIRLRGDQQAARTPTHSFLVTPFLGGEGDRWEADDEGSVLNIFCSVLLSSYLFFYVFVLLFLSVVIVWDFFLYFFLILCCFSVLSLFFVSFVLLFFLIFIFGIILLFWSEGWRHFSQYRLIYIENGSSSMGCFRFTLEFVSIRLVSRAVCIEKKKTKKMLPI